MPRVKRTVAKHQRKKRMFKRVKGYIGGRSKLYRTAHETLMKAQLYSFNDRKAKKRTFRKLWITRISAALFPYEISYSKFIGALIKAQVDLNRKMIAEMAISDPKGFQKLVEMARPYLPQQAKV